jgi:hypothetical protein
MTRSHHVNAIGPHIYMYVDGKLGADSHDVCRVAVLHCSYIPEGWLQ